MIMSGYDSNNDIDKIKCDVSALRDDVLISLDDDIVDTYNSSNDFSFGIDLKEAILMQMLRNTKKGL